MPTGIYERTDEHKRKISEARQGRRYPKLSEALKGRQFSDKTRQKMSEAHKGQPGYWTGKHRSEESIEKMRERLKGRHLSEEHKEKLRGKPPWNTGKHLPEWIKEKIANTLEGRFRGVNSPSWKGGLTPLVKQIRNSIKYQQWRWKIFMRDNFTCQNCSNRGTRLNAHHKKPFRLLLKKEQIETFEQALDSSELWNINIGTTLCKKCHKTKGR